MKVAVAVASVKLLEVGEPDYANGQTKEQFLQGLAEGVREDPFVYLGEPETPMAVTVMEAA